MKKIAIILISVVAIVGFSFAAAEPALAASNQQIKDGINSVDPGGTTSSSLPEVIKTILNIMLYIIGVLCVIMIIYGGISYVISAGAADKVKRARDTIVYSVVGLVVAIIAFAIVQWVTGVLK